MTSTSERDSCHFIPENGEVTGIILSGASFECTGCKKSKPASVFGLRRMPDGIIRNQSQCLECR
jgi:hypothetical protein